MRRPFWIAGFFVVWLDALGVVIVMGFATAFDAWGVVSGLTNFLVVVIIVVFAVAVVVVVVAVGLDVVDDVTVCVCRGQHMIGN